MNNSFLRALGLVGLLAGGAPANADLRIFTCEPEWAALATELGGDRVQTFSATSANQDPHHIEARPSLIAKLRQADLAICTGAELEVGWMPMLLRQAANGRVQPGQPGHFEAAAMVERLEIPQTVDRSMGDVHAAGNPHVNTDPRRIGQIAAKLAERLASLDPANATHYRERHGAFHAKWSAALERWQRQAQPLRGKRAVGYHRDWVYLFDWLGIQYAGTIEPKPGVPASAGHLAELKAQLLRQPAPLVLHTPYQDERAARWLAGQTGAQAVALPYTVGGNDAARDLTSLFDDTLVRLLKGLACAERRNCPAGVP